MSIAPSSPASNVLRCIHCGWTTLKWRTAAGGRRHSGWRSLQEHLFEVHDIEVDLTGDNDPDNPETIGRF